MPTISASQLNQLKRAHAEITAILLSLDAIKSPTPTPEPKWRSDYARMWRLLKAVEQDDGDIGADEWTRLGVEHGYDPRGLGGFFRGSEQMMAVQGARRVLTSHGRDFIAEWESEFGPGQS